MMAFLGWTFELAREPFALAGYIALGAVAQSIPAAARTGAYWGLAIHLFAVALGQIDILAVERLGILTLARLLGAVVVTVGVHLLARWLRRRGGGPPRGPTRRGPALRRVK